MDFDQHVAHAIGIMKMWRDHFLIRFGQPGRFEIWVGCAAAEALGWKPETTGRIVDAPLKLLMLEAADRHIWVYGWVIGLVGYEDGPAFDDAESLAALAPGVSYLQSRLGPKGFSTVLGSELTGRTVGCLERFDLPS